MIDNGNNMNESLVANLLTDDVRHHNGHYTILSTSVANPSVKRGLNIGNGTGTGRVNVLPLATPYNLRILSTGVFLGGSSSPII